ncbi:MAG: cytidylate kinase-like family protein [Deltaproteobacteria bacterium]|nr:cytidylate kinase-like family protein [Deltaproteobacteria bacterium]
MENVKSTVVAISRQLGSGGSFIGRRVAGRFGFKYLDREILQQAAKYLGEEEARLSYREERVSGFWENFLRTFSFSNPESGYVTPAPALVYDKDLIEVERRIIREVADQHNAVIIGRGAPLILADHPGAVKVFVHAPREFRLKRVMEAYGISNASEALSMIEDTDRRRERYIRTTFGVHMRDARSYHLCIDTGAVGLEAAEEMVILLIRSLRHL